MGHSSGLEPIRFDEMDVSRLRMWREDKALCSGFGREMARADNGNEQRGRTDDLDCEECKEKKTKEPDERQL